VGPVGNGGKRTVVKGETLMSVAASEKVTRADLAKANGLALNADLKIGQVLKIPAASKAPVKAATKSPTTATKTTPAAPAPTFAPFKLIPVGKAAEAASAPADKK
jgi:LysM repeat protein